MGHLCGGALTFVASWSKGASVILLPLPFSSLPHLPLLALPLEPFSCFFLFYTNKNTDPVCTGTCTRRPALSVSGASKPDISSLQINYQLSPRPASVISLSGSRSDGLHCVLSLPPHRLTAISSCSRGLSTGNTCPPPTTTTTTLSPSRCVGERG